MCVFVAVVQTLTLTVLSQILPRQPGRKNMACRRPELIAATKLCLPPHVRETSRG